MVLISHNLNDIFEVADDIAVLYLGRRGQVETHAITNSQVVDLITTGALRRPRAAPGNRPRRRRRPSVTATTTSPEPGSPRHPCGDPDPVDDLARDYVTGLRGSGVGSCPPCSAWSCWCAVFTAVEPDEFTNAYPSSPT